jgi:hypothetical protein
MRIGFRAWTTRKLHSGDLAALSAIAKGGRADEDRIDRLTRRGFVAQRRDGRTFVTARGRVALAIRRLTPR